MTIRRDVNLKQINSDYSDFQLALELLPRSLFQFARSVQQVITDTIDNLELTASIAEVPVDRCDRIREVEALTFDMIRQTNASPANEIWQVVKIGCDLSNRTPQAQREYIANLTVPA